MTLLQGFDVASREFHYDGAPGFRGYLLRSFEVHGHAIWRL